jgi:hypothetical protein
MNERKVLEVTYTSLEGIFWTRTQIPHLTL